MTCHISKTLRGSPSPASSTDIITYRYNDKLVYVPMAHDYVQALAHARDAFPQLKCLCDASLSLSLISPGHEHKFVGISAPVWPKLTAHMARFQVIDVHTAPVSIPDITITYADADDRASTETEPGLPPYRGRDIVDDEKAPCPRPQSLSTTTLHSGRRFWIFQKLHANAP